MNEQGLPPNEVKLIREKEAYPLIKEFEKWIEHETTSTTPQSSIGKALRYAYALYPRMARYVTDGRYRIDNNLAETMRPLALGRKNYLFCRNHRAAVPYGHCLLSAGDMPTVGNRSRKMAYRCILTHPGLLRKEARRDAAA